MRYLGSKDKLIPEISALLCEKGLLGRPLCFFDAFCGTGAVANSLKDSFRLVINDSLTWCVLYSKGRILGNKCTFERLGFDPFEFFDKNKEESKGFMFSNYSPGGSDRMYFTAENAGRIDFIRETIESWKNRDLLDEDEYAYLIYCLIEGVSGVSNTAGVYGAYLKHWDARAHNQLRFSPVASSLFDGNNGIDCYCGKVEDIIDKIDCDILYLDPPYTQNQYGTQYHLLETLVLLDNPPLSKITGSRPVAPMKSSWSKESEVEVLFDYVVSKTRARYIVMSYNNDGILSKDFIESTMKRYGNADSYVCQEIGYKKYNNFKCRGKEGHCEYLFFVEKRPMSEVIFESPLNYSGSKAKMIPFIKRHIPDDIRCFVDAFGGGFNVGVNIDAEKIIYNDINGFVMNLVRSFAEYDSIDYLKHVRKLIKKFKLAPTRKEEYNELRSVYNNTLPELRDSRMLYTLILFGFQQQIRFNSDYGFNIPCGTRRFNDNLISKFVSFTRVLKEKNVEFKNQSVFELKTPVADAFFYCDPPYRETTATYNDGKRGFEGWTRIHEQKLCGFLDSINEGGGKFMLSYILRIDDFYNCEVEQWAVKNGYSIIPVDEFQGRYNNREEVLIINYQI